MLTAFLAGLFLLGLVTLATTLTPPRDGTTLYS
jgi:hypothetical protein